MGGADASGEGAEQCLLPESKPTRPGGGALDEEGMTPAQKAQEKVTRAFREQVRVRVVFAVPSLRTPTASSAGEPYLALCGSLSLPPLPLQLLHYLSSLQST